MANIIITGEMGTGKDFILNKIVQHFNVTRSITDTTRPIREGEVDGIHYNFRTLEEFEQDMAIGRYMEVQSYQTAYGTWLYGSRFNRITNDSIIILDAEGAETYKQHIPFTIHIHLSVWDETERFYRSLARLGDSCNITDVEEVYRRINKDKNKFKGIEEKTPFVVPQIYNDTTVDLVFSILDSMCVERRPNIGGM